MMSSVKPALASLPVFWVVTRWGLGPSEHNLFVAVFWASLFGLVLEIRNQVSRGSVDRRVSEESKFLRPARLPDHDLRNPPIGSSARIHDE